LPLSLFNRLAARAVSIVCPQHVASRWQGAAGTVMCQAPQLTTEHTLAFTWWWQALWCVCSSPFKTAWCQPSGRCVVLLLWWLLGPGDSQVCRVDTLEGPLRVIG